MRETGTFCGIGVGPGAFDLLTLRAVHAIESASVIAVPVARRDRESYALSIVAGRLRADQTVLRLHFPMLRDVEARTEKRRAAAQQIAAYLDQGQDVAFLTEGDPTLHSTFGYLLEHLPAGYPVHVVPGVTSIAAAAADTVQPLVQADERLAVIPATFEDPAALESVLRLFDTVVLLKVFKVLDQVLDLLENLGIADRAVVVERASHPKGRVLRDVSELRGHSIHYLSLMIVYSRRLASDR